MEYQWDCLHEGRHTQISKLHMLIKMKYKQIQMFTYSTDSYALTPHAHTHSLPVTMTSPTVCLGPLPGFGRGWGGMLKKPGEAKHTVPQWGWREVEAWSEGGGGLMLSLSLLFLISSQSAETPWVSAKRWSIPSVYFTYFCCSPCLSLSLIPIFPVSLFSYFMFYLF